MSYVLPWDLILRKHSWSLFNIQSHHDIAQRLRMSNLWPVTSREVSRSALFSSIRLKWFLDHFTLEPVPLVNSIWIITFVSHLHVWLTKFKPSLMFFQLLVLTSKDIICVSVFAVLFDKTQHVVKTSTTGYVPVCYEVINLFIDPPNVLLMFLICKLKGLYLIVTTCDGLLMFFLYFFSIFFREPFY